MLPKIECSDELLLGILNQESECSTELGLQHLDNCEHCQARIEELAANEQQWTLAREGLCARVEGGLDIESEFESPTRFVPTAEYSSDWTDTMAKQLLQPPSHPEMLGRLGRYEIERLVGSGGMGVVFKAYDSELHRSVAIKMLAPHLSGSRSARERFAREARAAAAIVNDHVVPIHNVETEHATPYLVMQYIAGDSLQARLDRDGPLDVCEILRIGMQVATGLAAAHAQGLIHRDVKPSNIMLDENVARALLTDFGLARTQDEACLTRSGFHPGTPHYMSPEQVRGEELDGRSDLFSLGCVLYALCTGHPPYRADSGYAVMRRITDEQPRSIREQNALIPEWLERVVMRLLEKARESRFQSAEELAQILEQCLAHVQKPATEPLPLAVVHKASFFDRGRIRNWILAGMASAFLFFAGVFIVLETNKGTITIKSEADNVPIRIKRSDQVVEEMVVSRTGKSIRLAAGEYVIEFDGDSQDLVVEGGNVSLVRGDTKTLQIVYKKSDSAETRMSSDKSESKIDHGLFWPSSVSESTWKEKDKRILSAMSRLTPATVKVDDQLGVLSVKGSQADVQRANSVIESVRRSADEKDLSQSVKSPDSEETSTETDKRVLSAISRLDVPATITVDEETGVVTIKGSQAAVEKTNRMIEMIRKVAQEQPNSPIDWTKLNAEVPVVESELAIAVNEFNRNAKNWWALRLSNSPMLTEDELCAALWFQANHTDISNEARKQFSAIVLDRKLPAGWSIQLSGRQWDTEKKWSDSIGTSSSIEINLMHGNQVVSTIRSQFSASGLSSRASSPLADAISQFNKEKAGVEPPLTQEEVLAAITELWSRIPDPLSESHNLTDETIRQLKQLAEQHAMDGVIIDSTLHDHEVGDSKFLTWTIDLLLEPSPGKFPYQLQIRKRFIQVDSDRISARRTQSDTARKLLPQMKSSVEEAKKKFDSMKKLHALGSMDNEGLAAAERDLIFALFQLRQTMKTLGDSTIDLTDSLSALVKEHLLRLEALLVSSDKMRKLGVDTTELVRKVTLMREEVRGVSNILERDATHHREDISRRGSVATDKESREVIDKGTGVAATHLATAIEQFNQEHSEQLHGANTPLLTEDEVVASLWWQYRQSDLTEELKEIAREVAMTRTLPKGWSLGLRLTKWGNDKFWETPEKTKSIEIELQRGDGTLIRIRSQYVASRLITSWNYRSESLLRSAIAKFNSQYTTTEPAITCDEVVAAISTLMENSPSELTRSHGLTEESIQTLRRVAMMHKMWDFTFERLQSDELEDGDKFATWSVRLTSPKPGHDGKAQTFEIRKRFIKVESDRISARMKEPTAPHTDKTPTPLLDFSKVNISTHESDLTAAVDEFNKLHSEKLRASNLPPLTEDEFVASLWWQYSQSKLREEISETVKEIVITRKLPPGWSIKLNTRSWTLPQQWWHNNPLSSSATQIDLIGKEGLATTIRNQFVSSDATSLPPPESPLKMAIKEFNKSHSEEPDLTLDETLAALSNIWGQQSWYSSDGLKPSTMDALMAVIDRHEMKGVKIELLRSYETGDDRFSVWSIRLVVQNDQDGSTQAFTIRERFRKVNSFSGETIHWGKPSDEGLQAGFRFKPAQTRYLAGQVVDVEFFYRRIHGKGVTATIPNAFHFNKIEIDVLGGDGKQKLTVEHDRLKMIAGWRREGIGEQPTLFKNRKIRFVDSPENLAASKQIPDDWTTNVMLPINTKCDITFDVPDFADTAKKSASLLTGSTQLMILNGSDDKRQLAIAPVAVPSIRYESYRQSILDSLKRKFDQGLATQDQVLAAEMVLLEARIIDAIAENAKSLPSLLKDREDILQRAFQAAKTKYEAGLIGIGPFSESVAELIQAKFATRIASDGHAEPQASVSQDDTSILLIEEFFIKQRTLGDDHPELLQLREKVLKLRFDHAFDEAGIQKRLLELNRERQQLLKTRSESHPTLEENSLRYQAVKSLRSGSFPKMLKMLVETDPRRANLLPQEWKGTWVVESATTGDGSPVDIANGSKLSISNSTLVWQYGELARSDFVVNGLAVNGELSLLDLHWRSESPNMQGGAATGDIQWLVEFRDNTLWIVQLDQPESPVPDSVDNIRPGHTRFVLKRTEPDSLSDDTIQLRKEVERLKTTVRGLQSQEKQVTHVRQLPFPKEMQGVWRIKEAFKGVVEKNGRTALAQYENQIVTISDSTMFLQSNVVGNYWYLSRLDSSSSPMQVDLSVWSGSDSVYKTFACLLEIQDNKLCLVRAESPGFPRPQSVQELRRGETCFVMTRIGDSPMTPEEVIQVAKEKLFEKEDRTVRFKVESVHAPFVLGEPSEGHREGELHLDCRPDPHDLSLDQFLVVLTAECQKKFHGEGVEDITKHFLGKTITAKGPVRGVEYTARAMRGEHFHLIVDDPSELIIDKSE